MVAWFSLDDNEKGALFSFKSKLLLQFVKGRKSLLSSDIAPFHEKPMEKTKEEALFSFRRALLLPFTKGFIRLHNFH